MSEVQAHNEMSKEDVISEQEVEEILLKVHAKLAESYLDRFEWADAEQKEQIVQEYIDFLRKKMEHYPKHMRLSNKKEPEEVMVRVPPPAMFELFLNKFLLERATKQERFFGLSWTVTGALVQLEDEDKEKLEKFYEQHKDKRTISELVYDAMLFNLP